MEEMPQVPSKPKPVRDPWALVFAVCVGNTLGLIPSSVVAFLIGGLMDDLGFSEIEAGVLGTIE